MNHTCTYGMPPNSCGKPAVVTLPAKGKCHALFFCADHAKIAREAFDSLVDVPAPKRKKNT